MSAIGKPRLSGISSNGSNIHAVAEPMGVAWIACGFILIPGTILFIFMTVFGNQASGKRKVAFGAPYPGKIVAVQLAQIGGRAQRGDDSGGFGFHQRIRAQVVGQRDDGRGRTLARLVAASITPAFAAA